MTHTQKLGHLAAILTIILWGTTFVSTKILLEAYQPVEILKFIVIFIKEVKYARKSFYYGWRCSC